MARPSKYWKMVHEAELKIIWDALEKNNFNITKTAEFLGMPLRSLFNKLKRFNLNRKIRVEKDLSYINQQIEILEREKAKIENEIKAKELALKQLKEGENDGGTTVVL